MRDWLIKKLGGYNKHQLDETSRMSYITGVRETESDYSKECDRLQEEALEWRDRHTSLMEQVQLGNLADEAKYYRDLYYKELDKVSLPLPNIYVDTEVEYGFSQMSKIMLLRWGIKDTYVAQQFVTNGTVSVDTAKEFYHKSFYKQLIPRLYREMMKSVEDSFKNV